MTNQPDADLYEILHVPSTVTGADLDRAFRGLARRFHPRSGRDSGDSEQFQRVLAAYAVLRDPVARRNYDRHRESVGRSSEQSRTWCRDVIIRTDPTGEPAIRLGPVHH